ncbi:DNA-binding transcriptional regulator YhcF (GntR family) [Bradyrhizobium elkanii]|nr:DNA-binding transcriptional regulator YhcF (GntR family) [Bradyrhizobium elkanii]MCS3969428.1 DNA-binding transcriptional regulator YhcF (GntR family) [Bradyrhizobium japonicum]
MELPLARYDIAEYLAVSVETVSRAITALQQRAVITLIGTRTVKILYREALEDRSADRFTGTQALIDSDWIGCDLALSGIRGWRDA